MNYKAWQLAAMEEAGLMGRKDDDSWDDEDILEICEELGLDPYDLSKSDWERIWARMEED